ncbi:GTPase Era [Mediannikoviicoccus vaginalis]|uniref:GTPase Era n=1 Tax=Mediannikoviicoccus vaginalis TaxID=2899727 RepID=UPI001F02BCF1|nr:GTPase Era [Mediannikoviicoccus vaginalis]
MFKSGFISIIGRSNVGKSTFLNKVIGERISIVSSRPQTTRNNIKFIYTDDKMQCIFIDTPGIQKPKNKLGEFMLESATSAFKDVDIITYIVDNSGVIGENENYIISKLKEEKKPIILLINKTDIISEERTQEIIKTFEEFGIFDIILPISALTGRNIDEYFETIYEMLPEGPKYYDEDEITDQSVRSICAEIVREKALLFLQEEVPHGINIEINKFKKRENRELYDIEATILVEKKSHKGIVIGKGGEMIKKIGMTARTDMETFLDSQVNLRLWVKIDADWRNNLNKLQNFGYK